MTPSSSRMSSTTWNRRPSSSPQGLLASLRRPRPRRPQAEADRGGEEPAGFGAHAARRGPVLAGDVAELAADHAERRIHELRASRVSS